MSQFHYCACTCMNGRLLRWCVSSVSSVNSEHWGTSDLTVSQLFIAVLHVMRESEGQRVDVQSMNSERTEAPPMAACMERPRERDSGQHLGSPWITWDPWDHLRLLRITCDHLGSPEITQDHLGSSGITWDHLGSPWIVWDHLGSSETICNNLGSQGIRYDHLESPGITWDQEISAPFEEGHVSGSLSRDRDWWS